MVEIKEPIINQTFFPLDKTNALKGLFAILVFIHHIGQNTTFLNGTLADELIETLGYLSVSVFLFLSGYGLSVSYQLKGHDYIKTFPRKKLLPFYMRNIVLIAIYLIFWQVIGEPLSTKRIVLSFLFGHTVIKYGWYIQATFVLYIFFFFAFKNKNKYSKILTFIIGYLIYFAWCITNDLWSMWYISVLAFVIGIIYAYINTNNKYIPAISGILFSIFYIFGNFQPLSDAAADNFKIASTIAFPIFVISIFNILPLKLKFSNPVSKISFEIYVLQGLFLTLFHSNLIYVENDYLYIFLSVVSTIIFSILLNKLFKIISKKG